MDIHPSKHNSNNLDDLKFLLHMFFRLVITYTSNSFCEYNDDTVKLIKSYGLPHSWTKNIVWPEITVIVRLENVSKYVLWSHAFNNKTKASYHLISSDLLVDLSSHNIDDVTSKIKESISLVKSDEYKNLISYLSI